jgi:hypothetical protein
MPYTLGVPSTKMEDLAKASVTNAEYKDATINAFNAINDTGNF